MSKPRQTKRQQERVRTLALDLMHRAIEISHTTQHDVNVSYAGRVNNLSLDIYVNGYNEGVEPIRVRRNPTAIEAEYDLLILDGIYLDDKINEIIDFFKVANAELDKLVDTLNEPELTRIAREHNNKMLNAIESRLD